MQQETRILIFSLTLLCCAHAGSAQAQAPLEAAVFQATAPAGNIIVSTGAATLAVQELVSSARQYADAQAPGITAAEKQRRTSLREKLSTVLDLREMAHLILIKQWDGLGRSDREKYASLLEALVEKIGYPQIEKFFNGKIDISYESEKSLDGGAAAVLTKIAYKEEDVTLATEFRLHKTAAGWRVYDVITDGESLLLIYRNQHSGIIKEKGFAHLLKLMEKKLNEAK